MRWKGLSKILSEDLNDTGNLRVVYLYLNLMELVVLSASEISLLRSVMMTGTLKRLNSRISISCDKSNSEK